MPKTPLSSFGLSSLIALLAGALLPLAFAPFNFFFIAFFSPAVLALLWQHTRPNTAAWRGFCFGVGLFGTGASWIFVSIHQFSHTPFAMALLITFLFIIILAGFIALQGWVYAKLITKHTYLITLLAFPSIWVLFEGLRSWLFTGFPWLFLGYSQIDTYLGGFAPVLGVYGVSWCCAATGVLLLSIYLYPKRVKLTGLMLITLWGSAYAIKTIQWTQASGDPISVALLQGNIDQNLKWNASTREFILQRYEMLMAQTQQAELIIWPEAAFPIPLPQSHALLQQLSHKLQCNDQAALIGLPVQTQQGQFLNSIVALGTDAYGVYYKRHLVPFGEFVPLEAQIRGLVGFFDLPMSHGVSGPYIQAPLHAGSLRVAPLICYEIVYPELARGSLHDANILLTVSNDTWFGRSIGPHQHFEMARMRALELGRFLIRSTNNGISAIVDHQGKVVAQVPQFIATTLIANVYATEGYTPLYFLSHYFMLILSSLLLVAALLLQLGKFPRKKTV